MEITSIKVEEPSPLPSVPESSPPVEPKAEISPQQMKLIYLARYRYPYFFIEIRCSWCFAKTACRTAWKAFEFSQIENTFILRKRRKISRKHYKFHTKNIHKIRPAAIALFSTVSSAKKTFTLFWRYIVFTLVNFEGYLDSHPESCRSNWAQLTESNIPLKLSFKSI